MVRYFEKFHLKQFIPKKPIRFGYKVCSSNTPREYLLDFEVYQGKSENEYTHIEKLVGKSAAPLLKMVENFPEEIKSLPFHFYVINLFTTFKLLSHMQQLGYGATGTLRENRIPNSCPLASNKVLKKFPRGHTKSIINKPHGVLLCKWVDNSVVVACSNTHGISPITEVSRYSFTSKTQVQVPRPAMLSVYNQGMGGTDWLDQNVNLYRIQIRNRKWYWPLVIWMLNVALQSSWILHRHAGNDISHLDFRRGIALTYLKKFKTSQP
ncbi:piggyBac transposable element-derived protein 3-like [Belonocnema kinseyi]|uniref:piggyBac transposable element-derived protein 3-like n=1 Tax=Belonocnema kinseyi TaxID=2817044 RepID=UPI00143D14F0|nr:piggyBac transposable element-derived protein 3-like [Belonocnema kinseyi]